MVSVRYAETDVHVESVDPGACVMHTSKTGSYLLSYVGGDIDFSRYSGWHIPIRTSDGWDLYKTLHSFLPRAKPLAIERDLIGSTVAYDDGNVTFTFISHVLSLKSDILIPLVFDVRAIHDFDSHGRFYNYYVSQGVHVVEYLKRTHDDPAAPIASFSNGDDQHVFVAFTTNGTVKVQSRWFEARFAQELARGTVPASAYLYHACDVIPPAGSSLRIDMVVGQKLPDLLEKLGVFAESGPYLARAASQYTQALIHGVNPTKSLKSTALIHAIKSFDDLLTTVYGQNGIYAGLPWFYQFWSRDTAVSLKALIVRERYSDALRILRAQLDSIHEDGRLPNRMPHSDLGSADAFGWMCKRWLDLFSQLGTKMGTFVSDEELRVIRQKVAHAVVSVEKYHFVDGLVHNAALETWMDTGVGNDVRDGARIEIQALHLCAYRLVNAITRKLDDGQFGDFFDDEERFVSRVLSAFSPEGTIIHDGVYSGGVVDRTIRPNVFLAYYLYPELAAKKQWDATFERALAGLFMDWGGVATIDKHSPLFSPRYTGQDNVSYHHGDSWYFVNNIVALSLSQLHPRKYAAYIDAIQQASVLELLTSGALGACAEVSDAASLGSKACMSQAWSLATLIELLSQSKN